METITHRDVRVVEGDFKPQKTDTWVQIFYGEDTEPSERGFYNHKEQLFYGIGLIGGKAVEPYTFFVAWYDKEGRFQGSSSHPHYEESEFPVDRQKLINWF